MLKLVKFLEPSNVISQAVRTTARYNPKHNKKFLYNNEDRQVIEGRISYYPRYKGEPEPDHEPSKLFKVTRVKKIFGLPHWEKRILRDMMLYGPSNVAIVKNIPENNARLWKVKHLVRIEPITFPHGEPTKEDVSHTFLKDSGECIVVKEIGKNNSFSSRLRLGAKSKAAGHILDGETLRKDSRLKWLNPWQ